MGVNTTGHFWTTDLFKLLKMFVPNFIEIGQNLRSLEHKYSYKVLKILKTLSVNLNRFSWYGPKSGSYYACHLNSSYKDLRRKDGDVKCRRTYLYSTYVCKEAIAPKVRGHSPNPSFVPTSILCNSKKFTQN